MLEEKSGGGMKNSHLTRTEQVITVVSAQGNWVKILQAKSGVQGNISLLALKARQVNTADEKAASDALKELVRKLPVSPRELIGLLPTGEILTRYLRLPSSDPDELRLMALYQLEGLLPYPVQQCVTSVKVLGPAGETTRVLAAAVHRPLVDRLIRICKLSGLHLSSIATSSESIGYWHRACRPSSGGSSTGVWLVAELGQEGLDVGILVEGSLVYMRQVTDPAGELEQMAASLKETIQAYSREQVGPPVQQITVGGRLDDFGQGFLERLEALLELPVSRVDPLESSPFRESLSVTAQEFGAEVSFSELLGAACGARLIGLDLLPLESQLEQARETFFRQLRRSTVLAAVGLVVVFLWIGAQVAGLLSSIHQAEVQTNLLKFQAARVQAMAAEIRAVSAARQEYAFQLECLGRCAEHLSAGMTLQFLGLEAGRAITVRGAAPDLAAVTNYLKVLRQEPVWGEIILRSAKSQTANGEGSVEFEISLQPKKLEKVVQR